MKPEVGAEQLSTAGTIEDGPFPILVVRLANAVYQREVVEVREGVNSVEVAFRTSFLQHPSPYTSDRQVSRDARDIFLDEVLVAVRRTGFRMCVVWSPVECTFVEADGSVRWSHSPPSGGGGDVP